MWKKRFTALILALTLILTFSIANAQQLTRQNWVQKVGFRPNLEGLPFNTGDVIDGTNADQAANFLPPSLVILAKKYNLSMEVGKYQPIVPSNGYIAATNKYLGQPKITDTGKETRKSGIANYTAGLPVLQPKTGLEVAWNYHYSYNGDDSKNHFAVYWISAKRGVERYEIWDWNFIMRGVNRTDIQPIPAFEDWAKKGISYASLTVTQYPQDKKGFSALYYRYNEPKDQEGWIYLPQQRRPTRFTFGTRGDAWNNTDMLYEDVRGYLGYPEWQTWKLVKKTTMYAPMHTGIPYGEAAAKGAWDLDNAPHWNPRAKWEPRPIYVIEATPKFPDYPYSKMVFYIDAETFYIFAKECYDKKGLLWKVIMNLYNSSPSPTSKPLGIAGALAVDLLEEHATAFIWYSNQSNVGFKTHEFSASVLQKIGK